MKLTSAERAKIYGDALRIRMVEEKICEIYHSDKIKSPVHLSIGQELVSVAVCSNLKQSDAVFGTYRSHAIYLAKGGDLKKMIAELYGRASGCAAGRGGSMHLTDPDVGVMGTSAIVSTSIPNAVGFALAMKMKTEKRIVVSFFGDGAMEEGVFWESVNFAALRKLPILFVCENNSYAIHSHWSSRVCEQNYVARLEAFGVNGSKVSREHQSDLCDQARFAVDLVRNNNGPFFLEVETYRFLEHVGTGDDTALGYRSADEIESWMNADLLRQMGEGLDPELEHSIRSELEHEISEAFIFAEDSFDSDPFMVGSNVYR